jgi:hypothetical protein
MKFELTFDSIVLYREATQSFLTVAAPRIVHRAETMMTVPSDIWDWCQLFFGPEKGNFILFKYANSENIW